VGVGIADIASASEQEFRPDPPDVNLAFAAAAVRLGREFMPEHSSEELLAVFDRCPLHARYWAIFGLVSAVAALDFFDFFSVGFLVAKIAPDWHLTYGQ
jgi:hypothetical protein